MTVLPNKTENISNTHGKNGACKQNKNVIILIEISRYANFVISIKWEMRNSNEYIKIETNRFENSCGKCIKSSKIFNELPFQNKHHVTAIVSNKISYY